MSVYTTIDRADLELFLQHYAVGELVLYEGITAGIENTNYFVTTTEGEWVLTIFETLTEAELPFCLNLMAHLANRGIPSPAPVETDTGQFLLKLKKKPAALVQRLSGRSVKRPELVHCAALGTVLGKLHQAGTDYREHRPNSRGPHWWRETAAKVLPLLADEDARLLRDELSYQGARRHLNLPRGVIHGDLFHDNALFTGDRLSGVIDFYYACNDVLLFDIATAVNDWCVEKDGSLDEARVGAVLSAYARERMFTDAERNAWVPLLRAGALRFWLSRLHDMHFPRPGELTHTKDPDIFKNILRQRIDHPPKFPDLN